MSLELEWMVIMNVATVFFAKAALVMAPILVHAQSTQTSMQQAAHALSQDLADALPRSSVPASRQQTLTADVETLIKAADARAQGSMPDRSATRAAARELNSAFQGPGFQASDAQRLNSDLQSFKASAR